MSYGSKSESNGILIISAGLLLENMDANKVHVGFIWEAFGPVLWRLIASCGSQYAVMFHQFADLRNQFCKGKISSEDFRGGMNAVLGREISKDRFWQVWNSMLENVPNFSKIEQKFELLKKQYESVIVVSDTNDVQVNYLINEKGYEPLFKDASLSYDHHMLKEDLLCESVNQAKTSTNAFVICMGTPRGPEKERLEQIRKSFLERFSSEVQLASRIVYVQQPGIDYVLSALNIKIDPKILEVSSAKLKLN